MKYLLDTNTCVEYLRGKNPHILNRFIACPPTDIALCSVVVGELLYGAERSSQPVVEVVKVDTFVNRFLSLPFDDHSARVFGRVRADLATRGCQIGPYDTMIAAIALVHSLTVVTHNTKEFGRIGGLPLQDWELP